MKTTKKNGRLIVIVCGAVVAVALAAGVVAFRSIGTWLCVDDPPPPRCDILFTFAGNRDRYDYSKAVARRYPAARWILSIERAPVFDTLTMRSIVLRNLVLDGFDTARVEIVDTCTSTFSEIDVLTRILETYPSGDSVWVALISSPYHMRRIMRLARRRNRHDGVHFAARAVPPEYGSREKYRPDRWWRHEDDAAFVITEIIKTVYYRIKYR